MNTMSKHLLSAFFTLGLLGLTLPALADETVHLRIKDHRFQPAELTLPAGTRIRLLVKNEDSTPEEFESHSLHAEKIIPPGTERVIMVGPLSPGSYTFFGEFNPKTAHGRVIVN